MPRRHIGDLLATLRLHVDYSKATLRRRLQVEDDLAHEQEPKGSLSVCIQVEEDLAHEQERHAYTKSALERAQRDSSQWQARTLVTLRMHIGWIHASARRGIRASGRLVLLLPEDLHPPHENLHPPLNLSPSSTPTNPIQLV